MKPELIRRARPGLGTLVDIAIDAASAPDAGELFAAVFSEIEALEACLSAHRDDSELNRVCSEAHRQPQAISAPLRQVLEAALELHRQSQGIFEVTVPCDRALAAADATVTSTDIEWCQDGRIRFRRPLRIDLGGIAKGYVIDRVVALLQVRGVCSGRVNAGGDLRVYGGSIEPVALRFADGFRTVAQLHDGAFAASRPGLRPMSLAMTAGHHHVDGRDRRRVETTDTIAVFAPNAMIADALTKIALVCPATMDRLCEIHSAQWRCYPFQPEAVAPEMPICDAA